MKMSWPQVSLRIWLAMVMAVLVLGTPTFLILFAGAPVTPWEAAQWTWGGLALRVGGVLLLFGALSAALGRGVGRGDRNPFEDLTESIQRIAARDFGVRLGPYKFREPHEMLKIAEAFNRMAAELERAEELRVAMMADVSHELRTPLTVLEGNLRAALDRVVPLDEAEIANLYAQTRHLIRLVDDLRELALAEARHLPLHRAPTDLADVVDETLQVFVPLAEERGVALRAEIVALPPLDVDAARMRQMLHNLLTNALRHTPPGGLITVAGRRAAGEVVLEVHDSGDGLEADQLAAVFDRFYRTDRSRSRDTGGSGLGLAIVSAIVAAHGGSVRAASDGPGQGSTFSIHLPLGA